MGCEEGEETHVCIWMLSKASCSRLLNKATVGEPPVCAPPNTRLRQPRSLLTRGCGGRPPSYRRAHARASRQRHALGGSFSSSGAFGGGGLPARVLTCVRCAARLGDGMARGGVLPRAATSTSRT